MTETLSFRRSVASLSHIRLRVTQSGGVHDKLPVHISSADWWNILLPLARSPGIASDNRLILRLEE